MTTAQQSAKLYSKLTILFFTAFGTAFFGAVLFGMNLKAAGKDKKIFGVILAAMGFNLIVPTLLRKTGITEMYSFFPMNIIAGLFLTSVLWKDMLPTDIKFENRPIWKPLLILLAIWGTLIGLNLTLR